MINFIYITQIATRTVLPKDSNKYIQRIDKQRDDREKIPCDVNLICSKNISAIVKVPGLQISDLCTSHDKECKSRLPVQGFLQKACHMIS